MEHTAAQAGGVQINPGSPVLAALQAQNITGWAAISTPRGDLLFVRLQTHSPTVASEIIVMPSAPGQVTVYALENLSQARAIETQTQTQGQSFSGR